MKLRTIVLGVAMGLAASYLVYRYRQSQEAPNEILRTIKNTLKKDLSISDSWILLNPITHECNQHIFEVYQGGIRGKHNQKDISLEFFIDTKTGELIDSDIHYV